MDSTKKVTKKLAGAAAGTAAWCTNVGNEHGQVLVSVLTAGEGQALDAMAAGLMRRYRKAGEEPPKVMYVDRDCCSQHGHCRVKAMFSEWGGLQVRLDICHFMRQFAAGVTKEAHPLYGIFMARLSTCIFEWDPEDVAALRRAKESALAARRVGYISEEAVTAHITQRELALHCRRRTRGVEETTRLIDSLISLFDSASGKDTRGVPLLDHERIQQIWQEQRKHVSCIQDPEDVPLYVNTGTLKKGGVELCCYRCARGSTSLESFHLHLNRFIPGTSASDSHFQAYLLEGLMRWNDDRMEDAVRGASSIRSYGSALREAVEQLSQKVLRRRWDERYRTPGAYTGELLGIEYLYSQTGKTLTPVLQDPEEEDRLVEQINDEDIQDEGFLEEITEDITVPVLYEGDPCRDLRNLPSSLMTTHQLHPSQAPPADRPSTSCDGGQHPAAASSALPVTSQAALKSDEAQVRHLWLVGQAPILRPGRRPAAATGAQVAAPTTTAPDTAQPVSASLGTLILNPVAVVMAAPGASTSAPTPAPALLLPASAAPLSRYTVRNRRRRALEEETGLIKRKYVRGVTYNTCSQCGKPKLKEFGHSRHGNATFCSQASNGKSVEEWLAEQKAKK